VPAVFADDGSLAGGGKMQLDPEERTVVETYLRADAARSRKWQLILAVGACACVAALVLLAARAFETATLPPLIFVLGLVVMAHALDERKRVILGRVIQKYDQALRDADRTDTRQ